MVTPEPAGSAKLGSVSLSRSKTRIINAALELFAQHGVSGTSLQMIADHIGVTKAAVYHQFRTKDEIVLAAAEAEMRKLEAALDVAEAEENRPRAQERMLEQLIDTAVERRRMVSHLQSDPVVVRFLAEHEPFMQLMERLYRVLTGDDVEPEARVPAAMITAAIGGAVLHPLVVDLDDETLRYHLLRFTRRFLGLPEGS